MTQKKQIGIIGCGNMGTTIALGILTDPTLREKFSVAAYDLYDTARSRIEAAGGRWISEEKDLATESDYIFLCVKPYQIIDCIKSIKTLLSPHKTVISIAAGQPLTALRTALAGACPAVQVMPNTPALIGEGVFGVCFDDPALDQTRKNQLKDLFTQFGATFILPEDKMNALMAVTGAGPAFVYDMMDAMMEAAVTLGFTRQQASEMVVALFRGSAGMVGKTGQHPAVLHSQVTSPKGSTIAGTNHMARTAVRGHIIDAVLITAARGKEMERE